MSARKHSRKKAQQQSIQQYSILAAGAIIGIGVGLLVLFWMLNRGSLPLIQPATTEQRITTAALSAEVTSVSEVLARDLMTGQVTEGQKGLIVHVSITNNTDTEQYFLPVNHVFIKGSDDAIYQMSPLAGVRNPITAGAIAPGATLEGDMSFAVSKDEADNWLFIDTRWNGMSPLVIKL